MQPSADLLLRIARIRWAAVALSLLMVWITTPPPLQPGVLVGLSAVMAGYNVPLMFSRRLGEGWLRALALVSLTGDFVLTAAWLILSGNDPVNSNYVVFMVVGWEAAILYYTKGTIGFMVAFTAALVAGYVEQVLVFHIPVQIGSAAFRFGIVAVMAMASGSLATASEERRASLEAAARSAMQESARLETVHRLARGLSSSLRREDVLGAAASALELLFPNRWSGVLLADGEGQASLVAGTSAVGELTISVPGAAILPGVDETLLFEDLWNSPVLQAIGLVPPDALRDYATAAVVPLHVGETRMGALVAFGRAAEGFDAEDVRVLESIAPQISTALENSRLYEEAASQSLTDQLTRLGNRRAFDRRLEEEIGRAQRHRRPLSLVILDIDHFKVYNDTHGHQAGDDILRRLGTALTQRLLRQTDIAFRYGGEEFAVIMPETTAEQARSVMLRVHDLLVLEPMPLGDHQPGGHLTISAGISTSSEGDSGAASLVESADLALYGAKQSGRNRTLVYDSELGTSLTNWTRVLPRMLQDRALHSVYQPIVRLDDRTTVAHEALARPDGHEASTGVEGMFAAAHRMGVLHDLDWLAFRAAVGDAAALPPGHELFVNITLAALMDASRDPEYLELVMQWSGRSPSDVVFEISEREAVTDKARLTRILRSYRELGFRFALDDVGEGHSTFELLAAAEPEYVKIARSLVVDRDSTGSVGTIRALVEFASATGARVVAEGIGDEATAQRMHALGVEFGQGYALGAPGVLLRSAPSKNRSTAGRRFAQ